MRVDTAVFGHLAGAGPEGTVGRDASAEDDVGNALRIGCGEELFGEGLDDGSLEASAGVAEDLRIECLALVFTPPRHVRLQSRKAELVTGQFRSVKGAALGIAFSCELVQERAARVAESEQLCDLVVGFACGVVAGGAQLMNARNEWAIDAIERGVTSGCEKRDERKARGGFFCISLQKRSHQMPNEVIDAHEGEIRAECDALRHLETHEKSADQSGATCRGDTIEVGELYVGSLESSPDDMLDVREVIAGGKLRNDPSIGRMRRDLPLNDVGEHRSVRANDRRTRLVAG